MRGWIAIAAAAAGLLVLTAAGAPFHSIFSNSPKTYEMEGTIDQYRSEIAKALNARATGDLHEAIKHFSAASDMPVFEYPNFKLWPDLAELYCRTGQRARGQALVNDFACAADVMAARKSCWLDKDGGANVRNPAVSAKCYRAVCGELYVAYFGQEPGAGIEYRKDQATISKLRKVCQ